MTLEPLPPYPVFERVPRQNYTLYIIIMLIVIVLTIVAAVLIYNRLRANAATLINRCPVGLCVIDLASGVKRCPASPTDRLAFNVATEDCTSGNFCQSARAPCAVDEATGTLNCGGACGPNNPRCNCQRAPT